MSTTFYGVALLFVVPYLFFFRGSVLPTVVTTAGGGGALSRAHALWRSFLTVLVVAHTLHALRHVLSPPVNLFALLGLPLTAPVSAIREALLEHQRDRFPVGFLNRLAPDVEVLLARLASFEARVVYVRYGAHALAHCTPCVRPADFALFAAAPAAAPYLRALGVLSLVTTRAAARAAWRAPALAALAAAGAAEAWWTLGGAVRFPVPGWTHTQTHAARHAALLLVPLVVHHLPAHSAPPCGARRRLPHRPADFGLGTPPPRARAPHTTPLATALASLSTTLGALRVLEWARLAGLRRRGLRDEMARYYAAADRDAAYARADAGVRREAARLGMAYAGAGGDPRGLDRDSVVADGGGAAEVAGVPLRARARLAARELVATFVAGAGAGRPRSAG